MWQSLQPFFEWAFHSWVGEQVRRSTWAFAYIEVVHLLGLTMLLGCVLVVALRLAGVALRSRPVAEVSREIRPFLLSGLGLAMISGALMFAAEAERCFESVPYRYKMVFLLLALVFQFTVVRALTSATERRFPPVLAKLAAAISLFLWFGVGWAGRAIAFF